MAMENMENIENQEATVDLAGVDTKQLATMLDDSSQQLDELDNTWDKDKERLDKINKEMEWHLSRAPWLGDKLTHWDKVEVAWILWKTYDILEQWTSEQWNILGKYQTDLINWFSSLYENSQPGGKLAPEQEELINDYKKLHDLGADTELKPNQIAEAFRFSIAKERAAKLDDMANSQRAVLAAEEAALSADIDMETKTDASQVVQVPQDQIMQAFNDRVKTEKLWNENYLKPIELIAQMNERYKRRGF